MNKPLVLVTWLDAKDGQYKSRVVQDKRDKHKKELSVKDVIEQAKDYLERDKLLRQAKSLVNDHE